MKCIWARKFSPEITTATKTTRIVDQEIRAIITEAHEKATEILQKHRGLLDKTGPRPSGKR
ncbi:MAG: hypothetical protein LRZ88_12200, partial [Candidatus Cloacimonetes bacterium]|nr:hypothetical protein [Candidatus Cloacimonadota bacterium]